MSITKDYTKPLIEALAYNTNHSLCSIETKSSRWSTLPRPSKKTKWYPTHTPYNKTTRPYFSSGYNQQQRTNYKPGSAQRPLTTTSIKQNAPGFSSAHIGMKHVHVWHSSIDGSDGTTQEWRAGLTDDNVRYAFRIRGSQCSLVK